MNCFYVRIKPSLKVTNTVHKKGCPFMPEIDNRIPLGRFSHCKDAVKEASGYFLRVNSCYFCNKECNEPKFNLFTF